jgi:hypothetical protein
VQIPSKLFGQVRFREEEEDEKLCCLLSLDYMAAFGFGPLEHALRRVAPVITVAIREVNLGVMRSSTSLPCRLMKSGARVVPSVSHIHHAAMVCGVNTNDPHYVCTSYHEKYLESQVHIIKNQNFRSRNSDMYPLQNGTINDKMVRDLQL